MYQDAGSVEDAEYHIMYDHYDHIKLQQDPTSATLKLTTMVHDDSPSVTLSGGEALVSSTLVNNALSATGALATAPLSVPGTLAMATDSRAASRPSSTTSNFIGPAISNDEEAALAAAATVSTVGSSRAGRTSHVEMNQIVSTSGEGGGGGVVDGDLVTSSSIDAVVTSMVDCQSGTGNGRKLPQQVIVKLVSDDTLGLDMVRIIAEQEVESASQHGLSVLTRTGTLVHTKLSEDGFIGEVGSDQYRQEEEVLRPGLRGDGGESAPCSVVWTCAYCHLAFTSSEAVSCHQEKDCTEYPNGLSLTTTTSQSTVDALMSPLRQQEEPTYEFKIERDPHRSDEMQDVSEGRCVPEGDVDDGADCETTWNCAVCGCEFTQPKGLNEHYMTHSIRELSSALFRFTTPQKVKRSIATASPSTLSVPAAAVQGLRNSDSECRWSKERADITITKIEEVMVDDPGDTPPQTPPQEKVTKKSKRKPGPKAKPREKIEKRKYVRKMGEDGKPLHQREYKIPPVGQGSRDPHTCYICNKVLSCRGNLAKHVVLHKEKKPWVCDLCGVGFNAKRDWDHHYLQHHTNKRPNVCEVCGKGYVDSYYLAEHMEFHREERPFSCDVCGKVFRTARCVARHKKRHEKDKKFTCAVCFKSFAVKGDLTSHIRKVHRNVKKSQAGKQQQQQPQLAEHQPQADQESQQAKSKDLTEFLLPGGTPSHILPEQLLPSDLESASLSGSVSTKDGIFISSDPLAVPSIIPISGSGENGVNCSYGVALTTSAGDPGVVSSVGDHATYIMINSADEEVTPHTVSSTDGLNIMYATPASTQQVSNIRGSRLDDMQHLSSSLGPSLVSGDGQLQDSALHQGQDTQAITTDENGLDDNHGSELSLSANVRGPTGEIATDSGPSAVHTTHDPNSGFHLELLSQTIQLELQRTQSSSTGYLG